MPHSRKVQSKLAVATTHRLNTYALAASAAGVGLLAHAQPVEAKIIYTPAHAVVGGNSSYKLDLNNDGIVDFTIIEHNAESGAFPEMWVQPAAGNSVNCPVCAFTVVWAAALNPGSQIGGGRYLSFNSYPIPMVLGYSGLWANVKNRYLGLKLDIDGLPHFGWARLSVEYHSGNPNQRTWRARITGYAYETTPDLPIKAGQVTEDEASVQTEPANFARFATLGALALGCDGVALWRREDEKVVAMYHPGALPYDQSKAEIEKVVAR